MIWEMHEVYSEVGEILMVLVVPAKLVDGVFPQNTKPGAWCSSSSSWRTFHSPEPDIKDRKTKQRKIRNYHISSMLSNKQ